MGEVVNLRKFRKQKERSRKEELAKENRRKHGQTKAEREGAEADAQKEEKEHAGRRLEEPDILERFGADVTFPRAPQDKDDDR